MRLELASNGGDNVDVVTIFKSSDERFRIVLEQTIPSFSHARELVAQIVLTSEDRLIPRFALSQSTATSLELALFSRGEETFYHFKSADEMNAFQTALTGYEVSHEQEGINCEFSKAASFLDCNQSHIQLWQDPIGRLNEVESAKGSLGSSSSGSISTSTSSDSRSRRLSLMPSRTRRSTITSSEGGTEADRIKLSALVLFAQAKNEKNEGRFAIIFVEIEPHVEVDLGQCDCSKDYNKCLELYLIKRTGKPSNAASSFLPLILGSSPILTRSICFTSGSQRHPKYKDLLVKETKFLKLEFKDFAAKDLFHKELRIRFKVRDAQLHEQSSFERDAAYRQDKPKTMSKSRS